MHRSQPAVLIGTHEFKGDLETANDRACRGGLPSKYYVHRTKIDELFVDAILEGGRLSKLASRSNPLEGLWTAIGRAHPWGDWASIVQVCG